MSNTFGPATRMGPNIWNALRMQSEFLECTSNIQEHTNNSHHSNDISVVTRDLPRTRLHETDLTPEYVLRLSKLAARGITVPYLSISDTRLRDWSKGILYLRPHVHHQCDYGMGTSGLVLIPVTHPTQCVAECAKCGFCRQANTAWGPSPKRSPIQHGRPNYNGATYARNARVRIRAVHTEVVWHIS